VWRSESRIVDNPSLSRSGQASPSLGPQVAACSNLLYRGLPSDQIIWLGTVMVKFPAETGLRTVSPTETPTSWAMSRKALSTRVQA